MGKTVATKQSEQQIEDTSLQSNINEFMDFFENDKEAIHNILDDFFLTWSYQNQASGMVKDVFNKHAYAYRFLKKILRSMILKEDRESFRNLERTEQTIGYNDPKFDEEAKYLVSCLQSYGVAGSYFEINYDLLAFAMPELIAGKTFIDLPGERRKELFDQFATLRSVLDLLANFVDEHSYSKRSNNSTTSNN
jgi:hypothetical protein